MGLHLCKEVRGQDKYCWQEVGTYEELEENTSVGKLGFFQKPKLLIMRSSVHDDAMAENENKKLSVDMECAVKTEMKPECYSTSLPKDDSKLSIEASATHCCIGEQSMAKKDVDSFAVNADDLDFSDIGGSYVMMPCLEGLPDSLLPEDSGIRHTSPLINMEDVKQAIEWSSCPTMLSLNQAENMSKWDAGRFSLEIKAIKTQITHLEKQSSAASGSNLLTVPRYIKVKSQDLVAVSGNEEDEVDDVHTGENDRLP